MEEDQPSLEQRFNSIVNDDVHELWPGCVEVSLECARRLQRTIPRCNGIEVELLIDANSV